MPTPCPNARRSSSPNTVSEFSRARNRAPRHSLRQVATTDDYLHALAFQAEGRGFESRRPLKGKACTRALSRSLAPAWVSWLGALMKAFGSADGSHRIWCTPGRNATVVPALRSRGSRRLPQGRGPNGTDSPGLGRCLPGARSRLHVRGARACAPARPDGHEGCRSWERSTRSRSVFLVAAVVGQARPDKLGDLGPGEVWPFIAIGVFVPGISQVLFVRAIRDIGASRTIIITGAAPLLAGLAAILFLDEPLRLGLLLGAVLVVGGAVSRFPGNRPGPRAGGETACCGRSRACSSSRCGTQQPLGDRRAGRTRVGSRRLPLLRRDRRHGHLPARHAARP